MAAGKRHSRDEPLTEHDVAERMSAAIFRAWRIVADVTNDPELHRAVLHSRYLTVDGPRKLVEALEELQVEPRFDTPAPPIAADSPPTRGPAAASPSRVTPRLPSSP